MLKENNIEFKKDNKEEIENENKIDTGIEIEVLKNLSPETLLLLSEDEETAEKEEENEEEEEDDFIASEESVAAFKRPLCYAELSKGIYKGKLLKKPSIKIG